MKKIYSLLLFSLISYVFVACTSNSTTKNGTKTENTAELTTQFNTFIANFQQESKTLPATFGEEWLDRQISPVKIDSLVCVRFLAGNSVINHELGIGGKDHKEITLDATKTYYYISKVSLGSDFISVIISDLGKEATSTYLLMFSPEGAYISGIVMQARYYLRDAETINKVSRESVISDSQMILCQEKLVGRNKFISYDISADGTIVKKD